MSYSGSSIKAQNSTQRDIGDLFSGKDTAARAEPELNKLYLPVLPIVGYAPANGFMVGAGIAGSMLLDKGEHTHISSGLANILFTSKHQINLNLRHNVYLSHDTWIFQGDWRLLFFTQSTYGLGIQDYPAVFSLNGISLEDETGAQPMKFNYLRLYETVFRRLNKRLYAGAGISVDYHYKIEDQLLDLSVDPPFFTSHYLYSIYNDFSTDHYSVIGFTGKMLYDNRDNSINPYNGTYLDFGFRLNHIFLGSTKNSSQMLIEARKYLRVGTKNNHMAFWFIGDFKISGSIPYLALPSIGWDAYNRSGRGYLQGRFRGENMIYAETEFRYQISRSGLLGGVVFLNAISVDNKLIDQKLLDAFAFGYGAGLRIKMNKETRTNICIDIGLGQNNSSGVYFGIQEAF
jgi:outer membrane protein assembly factor BamA